jgi:hypothetical protein
MKQYIITERDVGLASLFFISVKYILGMFDVK